jgi:rsbT co-antagonist protein RsbR
MVEDRPVPRLTAEDRVLIQTLGSRLRNMINDQEVAPIDVDRRDELGILANMVNRVAKELRNSRRRDAQRRQELEQHLAELRAAHATQERLLATIRELSTPTLNIYPGVLLVPLIGSMDSARAADVISTLLEQITARQAQIVILDVTGIPTIDTRVANVLLQAARAAGLLGARVILCGLTPHVAQVIVSLGIDLSTLTPCVDLQAAIGQALRSVRSPSSSATNVGN